ncbi:MAG: tetratricopeptide repeat protein [Deltaproteobacteria bacterium]|nr:tetratricopeptide repeat protein [Deltaproteobacteria bacterium]
MSPALRNRPLRPLLALLPLLAGCPSGPSEPRAPREPRLSLAQAIEYVARDDCAHAEPMLERLLAEHQGEPAELHHYLGVCGQARGDLAGATTHYKEALRRNPALFESRNNLGVVLGELGRHDEAIELLTGLTEAFPEESSAWYNLGYEQAQAGDLEAGLASLRKAAELDDCSPDALLQAGEVLAALGRHEERVETLQQALERAPRDDIVRVSLARALVAADRRDGALETLRTVVAEGTDPRALAAAAFDLRDLEAIDDALAAARGGVERAGDDDDGFRLAVLAFGVIARGAGRRDEAFEVLQSGIARLPQDPAIALYLGAMLAEDRRCDEALPLLKRAHEAYAGRDPIPPQAAEARDALTSCGAPP